MTLSMANAKSNGSIWGFGLEGGGVIGDNSGKYEDKTPLARGFIQLDMSKQFITRFGVSYLPIAADAPEYYSTQTVMGDVRLMFRPVQIKYLSPYLYGGVGATKDLKYSDSPVLLAVPFGVGFQTRFSPKFLFEVNGGYTLVLSDELDGVYRLDDDLNRISNKKHDGFFTLAAGIAFTNPRRPEEPKPVVVPVIEIDPKTVDTDGDGLTDYEEQQYGTDPNKKDTDGDGLSDYDEIYKYKTDPLKADTDGDGLSDGDEVLKYRTDPLKSDTDGDGLTDGDEVLRYRTDPLKEDTDGDGLSDGVEVNQYKTDPLRADTDGGGMTDGAEVRLGKNPLNPLDDMKEDEPKKPDPNTIDTDGDGLTDVEEQKYGTNPNKKDTDGDGLSDYDEIYKYRTDPLKEDTDGDGLSDGLEVNQYKTDPLKADTDGDGLSDYDEVMVHRTNPLAIDTDGGGLADGAEIKAGKNPLDPQDDMIDISKPKETAPDLSKMDTDGDGLTDLEEQKYGTDPNKVDTDGDGLSDYDEIFKYRTDPLKEDTDGDGLSDYDEVMLHRTDPLKIDTDGGGMHDGAEVKAGKNPLDPKDDLLDLSKGKKMILEGITFDTAQSTIRPDSRTILGIVFESLQANPDVTVIISGHTDSVGNDESNRALSLRRAQAVKDWLVAKGISSSRIKVIGKGEAEPRATNETAEGRAQNRRIEFEVEK